MYDDTFDIAIPLVLFGGFLVVEVAREVWVFARSLREAWQLRRHGPCGK